MRTRSLCAAAAIFVLLLMSGCAGMNAHVDAPLKSPIWGKKVVVFPFLDPHYQGRQIHGVGKPFSTIFTGKLMAAGLTAYYSKSDEFTSYAATDLAKACAYTVNNSCDVLITGVVTEWIDGATQWSMKADVAALTVTVYDARTCEPIGSASGRQQGSAVTLVDSPTTRFFEPLSEKIVAALLEGRR